MLKSALKLLVPILVCTSLGFAQVPGKLIYSFNGQDGRTADSGLVADSRGNLYGTTFNGGPNAFGSVYELIPANAGTWRETVLYNFNGSDGAFPIASLTFDSQGNLYGTTQLGGLGVCSTSGGQDLGCGVVFKLTKTQNGWQESTVYEFQPGVNKGVIPAGGVILRPRKAISTERLGRRNRRCLHPFIARVRIARQHILGLSICQVAEERSTS